jgi:hypothetical protein
MGKQFFRVSLAVFALIGAGCASRRAVRVAEPLPAGRYVVAPAPGDAVPPLPEGEQRWWLMSAPTGVRLLLPADEAAMLEGGSE